MAKPTISEQQKQELVAAVQDVSRRNNWNANDLLTIIAFETAGTLDPWQEGPTTKWGTHRGLIQWGEPQARQYGVTQNTSIAKQVQATAEYMKDRGVKPGDGILPMYASINAGSARNTKARDAKAGGTWGTVADKVNYQMADEARTARSLNSQFGPNPSTMNYYGTGLSVRPGQPATTAAIPTIDGVTRPSMINRQYAATPTPTQAQRAAPTMMAGASTPIARTSAPATQTNSPATTRAELAKALNDQKMAMAYGQLGKSLANAEWAGTNLSGKNFAAPSSYTSMVAMRNQPAAPPAVTAAPIQPKTDDQYRQDRLANNVRTTAATRATLDPRTGMNARQSAALDEQIANLAAGKPVTNVPPDMELGGLKNPKLGGFNAARIGATAGFGLLGPVGIPIGIIGAAILSGMANRDKTQAIEAPSSTPAASSGGLLGSAGSNYTGGWAPAQGGMQRATEPVGYGIGGEALTGVKNDMGVTSMLGDGGSRTYGGPGGSGGK